MRSLLRDLLMAISTGVAAAWTFVGLVLFLHLVLGIRL